MQLYINQYEIIDQFNLNSVERLRSLQPSDQDEGSMNMQNNYFNSIDYEWVEPLFNAYRSEKEDIFREISAIGSIGISVERQVGYLLGRNWNSGDQIFKLFGNMTALLPGAVTFKTLQFMDNVETGVKAIPIDYMNYLVVLRPFIEFGLCYLTPTRIRTRELLRFKEGDSEWLSGGSSMIRDLDNRTKAHSKISGNGHSFSDMIGNEKPFPSIAENNTIINKIPWLPYCDAQTYVDLIEKNYQEYILYRKKLDSLAKSRSELEVNDLIKDIDLLLSEIEHRYSQFQESQWNKGFNTALGCSLTVGSFFAPDDLIEYKEIILSILGTKTASDAAGWIMESRESAKVFSSEPLWFLWNWSKN